MFSPFRALSRRQMTFPSCCEISLIFALFVGAALHRLLTSGLLILLCSVLSGEYDRIRNQLRARLLPGQLVIDLDDFSNDVITLDTCLSMFVYIRARFRFVLIGGNLTAQSTGSHRGIGGGIQISET